MYLCKHLNKIYQICNHHVSPIRKYLPGHIIWNLSSIELWDTTWWTLANILLSTALSWISFRHLSDTLQRLVKAYQQRGCLQNPCTWKKSMLIEMKFLPCQCSEVCCMNYKKVKIRVSCFQDIALKRNININILPLQQLVSYLDLYEMRDLRRAKLKQYIFSK